jgi:hypothetical protein
LTRRREELAQASRGCVEGWRLIDGALRRGPFSPSERREKCVACCHVSL